MQSAADLFYRDVYHGIHFLYLVHEFFQLAFVLYYQYDFAAEHSGLALYADGFHVYLHVLGDYLRQAVDYAHVVHSGDIERDFRFFFGRVYPFGRQHAVAVVGQHVGGVKAVLAVNCYAFSYADEAEYIVAGLRCATRG